MCNTHRCFLQPIRHEHFSCRVERHHARCDAQYETEVVQRERFGLEDPLQGRAVDDQHLKQHTKDERGVNEHKMR